MNAPLRHPQEAASAVSRDWHAVLTPFLGGWEPVLDSDGLPLMFAYPGPAASAALGHKGRTSLFIRRSALRPSIEEIREVANPPRTPVPPVSFDIDAMDSHKFQQEAAKGHGVFEGRR